MSKRLIKRGGEVTVSGFPAMEAQTPQVWALSATRVIAVWQDRNGQQGDTSQTGISAQILGTDGSRIGPQFQVNTRTAQFQFEPVVTTLVDGTAVIAWADSSLSLGDASGTAIKAQRVDADGNKLGGEFLVNTTVDGSQSEPGLAGLLDGSYVAVWSDASGVGDLSGRGIKMQRFDAAGTKLGEDTLVNIATDGGQVAPVVRLLTDGRYMVGWTDQAGGSNLLKARVYYSDGTPQSDEIVLAATPGVNQRQLQIAALYDGKTAVVWAADQPGGPDASGAGVYLQLFSGGFPTTPLGGPVLVNTETLNNQLNPTVAPVTGGGFMVSWRDNSAVGADVNGGAIKAQLFDDAGRRVGDEFLVNTTVEGRQSNPSIVTAPGGPTVAIWIDDSAGTSIRGQALEVATLPLQTYNGTAGADTFAATPDADWRINGLDGADTLTGSIGDDVIVAGKGNDVVTGGGGDDRFQVGFLEGSDRYDGGTGFDTLAIFGDNTVVGLAGFTGIERVESAFATVSFLGTSAAETLNFSAVQFALAGGVAARINAGGGNDTLTGSAQGDILNGGAGNDRIVAGAGDDFIDVTATPGIDVIQGGDGFDTIRATKASLVIGLASLSGVERIDAQGFSAVTLAGSTNADTLDFSAVALLGIAAITGGTGNDTIIGSAGNDVINGQAGIDRLTGGFGGDRFRGTAAELKNDTVADFALGDAIVVTNYLSAANATATWSNGVLFIDRDGPGGSAPVNINLPGDFAAAAFVIAPDSLGGIAVSLVG